MGEKVSVSEIQDWVRTQEVDEPVPMKAKGRVTREIAEGIKHSKDLPAGRCHLCSRNIDKLVPSVMKVCLSCAGKFMKRGGDLPVIKKESPVDTHCDYCLVRTFYVLHVNPYICSYCVKTLGRTHRFGLQDMKKEQAREQKQMENHGVVRQ